MSPFLETLSENLRNFLRRSFGLDLRALFCFRVGFALVIFADLVLRMRFLAEHYTDWGYWPRSMGMSYPGTYYPYSIFFIQGGVLFAWALFVLGLLLCILLLIGCWTRVVTVLLVIFVASLNARNYMVINSGNILLYNLLFWSCFLPLNAVGSVDKFRARWSWRARSPNFLSVGTFGFTLQILCLYFAAALLKTGDSWRKDGTALALSLNLDTMVSGVAVWLRQFPELMKWGTFSTWWIEMLSPIFLIAPVFSTSLRTLACAALFGLHFGIAVAMRIGIFPYLDMVIAIALLPTPVWDGIGRWVTKRWGASSDYFLSKGELTLHFIADTLEARLGSTTLNEPSAIRPGIISTVLPLIACVTIVLANLADVKWLRECPLPAFEVSSLLQVRQSWHMFAPSPATEDEWMVVAAKKENGEVVDVSRNGASPINWEKPTDFSELYPTEQQRKFTSSLLRTDWAGRQRLDVYTRWICRHWYYETTPGERVTVFDVYRLAEKTVLDGPSQMYRQHLWHGRCGPVPVAAIATLKDAKGSVGR